MPANSAATTGSKAARTRERIIATAAHELAQHGYAGTTLRQVAAGAGLQLGSLYFHFRTKDELLAEVMREAVESTLERITAAVAAAPDDAGARLTAAIRVHLTALHESHDRGAAVLSIVSTVPSGVSIAAPARRYLRAWLPLVTEAQVAGSLPAALDPAQVRDLLVGALNSTMSPKPRSAKAIAALTETAVGLFVR